MAAAPSSTTSNPPAADAPPRGRRPTPKHLEPNKICVVIGIILMLGALFIAFGIPALGAVDIIAIPAWSAAALAVPAIALGIFGCWVFKKAGPDVKDQGLYDAKRKLKKVREVDSDEENTTRMLDTHGIDTFNENVPRLPRSRRSGKTARPIPADSSAGKVEEPE